MDLGINQDIEEGVLHVVIWILENGFQGIRVAELEIIVKVFLVVGEHFNSLFVLEDHHAV